MQTIYGDTPQPLYNTIWGQNQFPCYPNRVLLTVGFIGCIRKGVLNSYLGSNLDLCYNQNCVIKNRVIKRFRCSWSDISRPYYIDLYVMIWRSVWPIFHGQVILPLSWRLLDGCTSNISWIMGQCDPTYILKAIWWMKVILWIMSLCDGSLTSK